MIMSPTAEAVLWALDIFMVGMLVGMGIYRFIYRRAKESR